MIRRLIAIAFIVAVTKVPAHAAWQVGIAKADITPQESVPLAGYGGKTRKSRRVEHPIWVKALALRDETGATFVLTTVDLVGLSAKMVDRIALLAKTRHGIARENLILNASHNHSCPVTEDVLWLYYDLTADESLARDRYTAMVYAKYDEVIGQAIANVAPAELEFGQGLAGFAVNRRRARGPDSRKFSGPVDHDVPVLAVKSGGQLRAVVFGYSCHTTALAGLTINGDYAGYAQLDLEHSLAGCTAMFLQNCGGDANPLPRIHGDDDRAPRMAEMYGKILAESVQQVLAGTMSPVSGPLRAAMGETELLLQPGLSLQQLKDRVPHVDGITKREYQHLIHQYETTTAPPDRVRYPVQVWQLGKELTWIALTGETVVDYSLRFKSTYGWNSTWVCGYNNDLLSYVPSLRVLREGGYEGGTGMLEYGHRGPYTESVEQQIVMKVEELVRQAGGSPSGGTSQ